MAITELQRPEPPERKRLAEIGNLLSSVGNHEGKALLLASMLPSNIYFSSDLDRLMREKQGEKPVWRISNKTPFNICATTFSSSHLVSVGLSDHNLTTIGYEKTVYGQKTATSFAGHLLKFSEDHPEVSLIDLFGSTHSRMKSAPVENEGEATYVERTPLLHYRIFKELLSRTAPIRVTDLTNVVGRSGFIEDHLVRLSQHGILMYEWVRKGEPVSKYTVNDDKLGQAPKDMSKISTANDIYKIMVENPALVLSVDFLKRKLWEAYPETEQQFLARRIAYALEAFESRGYIKKGKFNGDYASEISLDERQRQMLKELMEILDGFCSNDPQFLEEGMAKAVEIVNDPRRFNVLLLKAKEASANANHANPEDTKNQIISILYGFPNIGNTEIQEMLRKDGKDVTRSRVAQLTRELKAEGKVMAFPDRGAIRFAVNSAQVI